MPKAKLANGYVMRLTLPDKELFAAAARIDGYEAISPWLRYLARARIRQQKAPANGH